MRPLLADVAVDDGGEAFTVGVIGAPTGPIALSSDFSTVAASIDTSEFNGVARTIAVSGDGNDVYAHTSPTSKLSRVPTPR